MGRAERRVDVEQRERKGENGGQVASGVVTVVSGGRADSEALELVFAPGESVTCLV
jgi:hypothetical protein